MDISRAIDRIRKNQEIKNQEETENELGGKPPEFNKWGENQMEVRSKITTGKLFSWEIRKEELQSFYDIKLS